MKRFLVFLFLLNTALAFSKGRSDWIYSAEKEYPSSKYVTGIGSAPDRKAAESSAKLALCQQLGETLKGQQQASITATKKDEYGTIAINVDEKVIFDRITGIQIAKTAKKGKTHYALAVLSRTEAGNYYYDKIVKNDSLIMQQLKEAESQTDMLKKGALIKSTIQIAKENEYNLDLLSVINPSKYKTVHLNYKNTNNIKNYYNTVATQTIFYLNTTGEHKEAVEKGIGDMLKEFGFSIINDHTKATYVLDTDIKTTQTNDAKFQYQRYSINTNLIDAKTESSVLMFSLSGREGHVTYEQATARVDQKIPQRIKDEYTNTLQSYLEK